MTATGGIRQIDTKVVLIHTNYDLHAECTSKWALEISTALALADHLHGEAVTAQRLRQVLQGLDGTVIVAFYGHGTHAELLGQHLESTGNRAVLVGIEGNCVLPQELTGHKIYAVACLAGSRLGPALKVEACEFIGYSDEFVFSPAFEDRFKAIVNDALIEWARGTSANVVCNRVRQAWHTLASELTSKRPREPLHLSIKAVAAGYALMNADCLTCESS
jgi:hypothetical protein